MVRYHFTSNRMATTKKTITNVGKDVVNLETLYITLYITGGNVK